MNNNDFSLLIELMEQLKQGDVVSTKYGKGTVVRLNGQTVTVQLDDETEKVVKTREIQTGSGSGVTKRDPNWEAMQAKRRSGAMGAHKNVKRELELGRGKYKGRDIE